MIRVNKRWDHSGTEEIGIRDISVNTSGPQLVVNYEDGFVEACRISQKMAEILIDMGYNCGS